MRIFFAGTPKFALPVLEGLFNSSHSVVGVLTSPDSKCGRGQKTYSSDIKLWSVSQGLPTFSPINPHDMSVRKEIEALKADLLVVFAYGKIFKQEFLDMFPLGAINVHPSLLPLHRGPSPLVASILAGERETGITVQKMALKMDTGNILIQEKKSLTREETLEDLKQWAAERSPDLVKKAIELIEEGFSGIEQDENLASYCSMINKDMGFLTLDLSPFNFVAKVRALNPFPSTRISYEESFLVIRSASIIDEKGEFSKGKVIGIDKDKGLILALKKGLVGLKEVQRPAKKVISAQDFWNSLSKKARESLYLG